MRKEEALMEIIGKALEYEYENGEAYQVVFEEKNATWKCLAGSSAGASGTESHDAIEVAPNILFVSWLESTQEVVSYVANLNNMTIFCSYVYENQRHLWKGEIKYFGPVKR
jgi:phenolic acid decarboxylase